MSRLWQVLGSRLALGLALILALPARGAGADGPRPAAREAELGKKKTLAPDAGLAGSIEARGASQEPAGPRLDFETFRYAIEVQVSGKRREEINDLEQLIRLGGSDRDLPGWYFRVAELHWEEAQYLFFEANRKDDAIAAAKGDPARIDQLKAEKKALEERSRAEQSVAVNRYREIFRRFPNYPRLDEVVFFLGENLWKQNRRKEALEAYKALITRFPKSRYVPDAWMAFGENYFDSAERGDRRESLRKALESYKRAAAFPASSVYGYALYKQGWVHYNLGNWNEALDLFRAVIFFGDLPTSTVAPDKKLALAREARKDYVRTYSHVGSPRTAPEEFARVGGKDTRDMLKSLADLYFNEGKDREAILVYHGLIVASPATPDATLFQGRIVTCAGRIGKKELAVQQAARFVEMLREAEKRGGDEPAQRALAEARRDAENTLRTLAVQYHAEFKKTREDAVAVYAAELYRLHLQVFPNSNHAYDMRFFHAELLYALEKFQEAGDGYTSVAQLDLRRQKEPGPDGRPGKAGKYLVDALESAVQAYDVVAKRAEANEKRPSGDGKVKTALPREKQQLVDACLRYLSGAPQGDKRVEIAYKAANVYYKYNAFGEATQLFVDIAERHPRHELARYAANLALDCYNLQSNWRGMNALALRFWGNAELLRAHPPLRDDLAKVIEQSAFKVVQELEQAQRPAEAAEAYVAFVRDWPGSKLAPTALFNASVDLVKAGRLDRATAVREELMQRYPDDPLVPKIVLTNAQDREAVADFERAADDYERYEQGWRRAAVAAAARAAAPRRGRGHAAGPRPPRGDAGGYEEARARDALYDAGVLREGLGQYARAEADRLRFVETWPEAAEAAKVFLSVADLYAKQRAHAKEVRQLEAYQERYAKDPTEWLAVQDRIARLKDQAGDVAGSRRAYEQALAYHRARRGDVGERGRPVLAQAEFQALDPEFQAYEKIDFAVPGRLSGPRQVKWLKERLQLKSRKLLELQKGYTSVVATKQAEPAVCALYRIGLGYKRFAQALQAAPLPPEIRRDKALADEYRGQLAQLAEAPEKKATEALEYAMTKSRELGVANACSRAATDLLVKVKPDQYGPPPERVPEAAPAGAAGVRPEGNGLLTALASPAAAREPAPVAPAAPALPPMTPGRRTAAAAPEGRDPDLPPPSAAPAARAAPRAAPPPPINEEDLLP